MNIKGVIFDVDGTLIDSTGVWNSCYEIYMKRRGLEILPEHINAIRKMTVDESGEYIKRVYDLPDSAKSITDGFNAIIIDFYMNDAELKPHMEDMLKAFDKKGIPMIVATASSEDVIEPLLSRLGIRHFFSDVRSCRKVGLPKTEPAFFERCSEYLGINAEDLAVVEDMPHAARSADAVKMTVIGVYDEPSASCEDELRSLSDIFLKTDEEYENFIMSI